MFLDEPELALYLHYDLFISKCLKMLFLPLRLVYVFMRMPQIKIQSADTLYIDLFGIIKLLPSLDLHMIATNTIQCIFKKLWEILTCASKCSSSYLHQLRLVRDTHHGTHVEPS